MGTYYLVPIRDHNKTVPNAAFEVEVKNGKFVGTNITPGHTYESMWVCDTEAELIRVAHEHFWMLATGLWDVEKRESLPKDFGGDYAFHDTYYYERDDIEED